MKPPITMTEFAGPIGPECPPNPIVLGNPNPIALGSLTDGPAGLLSKPDVPDRDTRQARRAAARAAGKAAEQNTQFKIRQIAERVRISRRMLRQIERRAAQ